MKVYSKKQKMIDLEDLKKIYLPKIDSYFQQCILPEIHTASGLKEVLEYQYGTGGKRLRPLCTILTFHLYREFFKNHEKGSVITSKKTISSKEKEDTYLVAFAALVELLHTATLIHDDYQDGDHYRRNAPCAWKKFSPEQAINSGDLAFFLAIHCIQKEKFPWKRELIEIVQKNMRLVIEGQGMEIHMKQKWKKENTLPSIENYQAMVFRKTAALFNLPMLGGAIIAGIKENEKISLLKATSLLGLSFQIRDDIIDLWGEKGRNVAGSDIAEGKLSYPILKALKKLSSSEQQRAKEPRKRLIHIIQKERQETTLEEIAWTLELLEDLDIKRACTEEYQKVENKISPIPFWGRALSPFCADLRAAL